MFDFKCILIKIQSIYSWGIFGESNYRSRNKYKKLIEVYMKSSPRFVKYNRLFVISFNCFTPTFVLASRIDPLKMFHFLVEKYSWINIGITDLVVLQSVGIEENFETILTWCMSRAENRTKNNVIPNLFAETLFRFCWNFAPRNLLV